MGMAGGEPYFAGKVGGRQYATSLATELIYRQL